MSELWRSLEESDSGDIGEAGVGPFVLTRRDFLKLAAASAALASAGCQGPVEEIVPHVDPERALPGEPRFFATAMTLGGVATGVLVESNDGRPTKIEGNPSHPASLGGTGVFEQAAILQLWDPGRSRAILNRGQPSTRGSLRAALMQALSQGSGEGVRILMRYSSSPTLGAQLDALRERHPGLRVHTWEPLHRDRSLAGSRLAFGRAAQAVYDFTQADIVVTLDADFIGEGPGHLRYARDFMARRRPGGTQPMNRLYRSSRPPRSPGSWPIIGWRTRPPRSKPGSCVWRWRCAVAVRRTWRSSARRPRTCARIAGGASSFPASPCRRQRTRWCIG
jgi:Anaerobic dehydrogenases, typically selenocysteine-containing